MLGDPQHRTFFLSPPPCPCLSTSHLTVVTPSLHCPHPSTISSLSTHHHLVTIHCPVIVTPSSSLFPCRTVTLVSVVHIPLFSVFTYILSVILLTPLFSSFMSHFYLSTPLYEIISASLFIHPPFPRRDPHLFLLGSPAR